MEKGRLLKQGVIRSNLIFFFPEFCGCSVERTLWGEAQGQGLKQDDPTEIPTIFKMAGIKMEPWGWIRQIKEGEVLAVDLGGEGKRKMKSVFGSEPQNEWSC